MSFNNTHIHSHMGVVETLNFLHIYDPHLTKLSLCVSEFEKYIFYVVEWHEEPLLYSASVHVNIHSYWMNI